MMNHDDAHRRPHQGRDCNLRLLENVYMKMELHFFNAFFNFLKMISQVSKGRELKICKRNANGQ